MNGMGVRPQNTIQILSWKFVLEHKRNWQEYGTESGHVRWMIVDGETEVFWLLEACSAQFLWKKKEKKDRIKTASVPSVLFRVLFHELRSL